MRKIVLLLLLIIIIGCEQTFDNIIDAVQNNFQVISVGPTEDVIYQPEDSLITITINFSNSSEVTNVFCDVFASDHSKLNSSPFQLFDDNNDNLFLNEFPLSQFYPNGIYNIKYYVKNADKTLQQVALASFKYTNGQDNVLPVIANTVIEPDTVIVNDTTIIFTSVEAMDPNGANDIMEVYFIVYKPDGSTNDIKILMFDDGSCCPIPPSSEPSGDLVAGNGIYSRIIQINQNNVKGLYRFEFRAKDRSGELSNIINHFVLIQ
ncbi:MAG: hypothetical protein O6940_00085 [Ignavibacteria bacterium]|nr:hypothetical protein [Ignavibacteria bacterium]